MTKKDNLKLKIGMVLLFVGLVGIFFSIYNFLLVETPKVEYTDTRSQEVRMRDGYLLPIEYKVEFKPNYSNYIPNDKFLNQILTNDKYVVRNVLRNSSYQWLTKAACENKEMFIDDLTEIVKKYEYTNNFESFEIFKVHCPELQKDK